MCPAIEIQAKDGALKGKEKHKRLTPEGTTVAIANSDHLSIIDGNICSYNILGQCHAPSEKVKQKNPKAYANNPWAANETDAEYANRLDEILKELKTIQDNGVDIFCLQETPNRLEDWKDISLQAIKRLSEEEKTKYENEKQAHQKKQQIINNFYTKLEKELNVYVSIKPMNKKSALVCLISKDKYKINEELDNKRLQLASLEQAIDNASRLQCIKLVKIADDATKGEELTIANFHADFTEPENTVNIIEDCVRQGFAVAGDFNLESQDNNLKKLCSKFATCGESAGKLEIIPIIKEAGTVDGILRGDKPAVAKCIPKANILLPYSKPPTKVLQSKLLQNKYSLLNNYNLLEKIELWLKHSDDTDKTKLRKMLKSLANADGSSFFDLKFLGQIIKQSTQEKNILEKLLQLEIGGVEDAIMQAVKDRSLTPEYLEKIKILLPELIVEKYAADEQLHLPNRGAFLNDVQINALTTALYRAHFPKFKQPQLPEYTLLDANETALVISSPSYAVDDLLSKKITSDFWNVIASCLRNKKSIPKNIRIVTRINHNDVHWTCGVTEIALDQEQIKKIQGLYDTGLIATDDDTFLTGDAVLNVWLQTLAQKNAATAEYLLPTTKINIRHYDSIAPGARNGECFRNVLNSSAMLLAVNTRVGEKNATILAKKCVHQVVDADNKLGSINECGDWTAVNGFVAGVLGIEPSPELLKNFPSIRKISTDCIGAEINIKKGSALAAGVDEIKIATRDIFTAAYAAAPKTQDVKRAQPVPKPKTPPATPKTPPAFMPGYSSARQHDAAKAKEDNAQAQENFTEPHTNNEARVEKVGNAALQAEQEISSGSWQKLKTELATTTESDVQDNITIKNNSAENQLEVYQGVNGKEEIKAIISSKLAANNTEHVLFKFMEANPSNAIILANLRRASILAQGRKNAKLSITCTNDNIAGALNIFFLAKIMQLNPNIVTSSAPIIQANPIADAIYKLLEQTPVDKLKELNPAIFDSDAIKSMLTNNSAQLHSAEDLSKVYAELRDAFKDYLTAAEINQILPSKPKLHP